LVATRAQTPALRLVRLAGAAAGVLMVIYLVYIELFQVNAICLWYRRARADPDPVRCRTLARRRRPRGHMRWK
jgi:uncharacterized iron-regulated membrane protein